MTDQNEKLVTIADLRSRGFTVRVFHWRLENGIFYDRSIKSIKKKMYDFLKPEKDIAGQFRSPTGARTTIHLTSPDGREARGVSHCSPYDAFIRKKGNRIALQRAIANLERIPIEGLEN